MIGADGPAGDRGRKRAGSSRPENGLAWVYESIVGAVPGVAVGTWAALAVQFTGFEVAVVGLWLVYDLPTAALVVQSVLVAVASVGSAAMVTIARAVRTGGEPDRYRRLVLGSRIELVLGLLAYVALLTYLFVLDERAAPVLVETLLGPEPPALAVFLLLLLLWDVCYRIGTAWWASVTGLWRTVTLPRSSRGRTARRRLDLVTLGFGLLQLALLPLLVDHPVLLVAVGGHVAAVLLVTGTARVLESQGEN